MLLSSEGSVFGRIISGFVGGLTNLVSGIAGAISGNRTDPIYGPIGEAMYRQREATEASISENQSKLASTIDKVQFYGSTWRSGASNAGGGGSPFTASNTQWSYLALDRNTGPLKGCHIDNRGLLILDRKGLWEVKVKVKGYSKESRHNRMLYTYVTNPGYAPPYGLQSSKESYGNPFYYSDASYRSVERSGVLYDKPVDMDFTQVDTFCVNIPSGGYGLMIIFSGMEIFGGASTTTLTASLIDTSVLGELNNG